MSSRSKRSKSNMSADSGSTNGRIKLITKVKKENANYEEKAAPNVEEWPPQDTLYFIDLLCLELEKDSEYIPYSKRILTIDWSQINVGNRTEAEYRHHLEKIIKDIKKYRTLNEIVEDYKQKANSSNNNQRNKTDRNTQREATVQNRGAPSIQKKESSRNRRQPRSVERNASSHLNGTNAPEVPNSNGLYVRIRNNIGNEFIDLTTPVGRERTTARTTRRAEQVADEPDSTENSTSKRKPDSDGSKKTTKKKRN